MLNTEGIKNKEVINIADGKSLGYVSDVVIDFSSGRIEGIILPGEKGLFSFFGGAEDDIVIDWENIKTIGNDVILVEVHNM